MTKPDPEIIYLGHFNVMDHDDTLNYEVTAGGHPCPICGNKLFEWGIVSRFTPLSYRRGFRVFRLDKTMGVKARHCLTCDHLQLFADEELADEQRRAAITAWLLGFVGVVIVTAIVLTVLGG